MPDNTDAKEKANDQATIGDLVQALGTMRRAAYRLEASLDPIKKQHGKELYSYATKVDDWIGEMELELKR